MNKLLEQLKAIPQFNSFADSVFKKLNMDNYYVEHFAPEKNGYYDEKGDDGKQVCYPYSLSDDEVENQAIENLLDDNKGYFDEFVHESISCEVTELVRVLIRELRK